MRVRCFPSFFYTCAILYAHFPLVSSRINLHILIRLTSHSRSSQ
jgi:hypothetical protein